MRKFFTRLLAGLMAVGCVCAMAGCGSPKLNIDDVENILEKNDDYVVEVKEDDETYFMGMQGIIEKSLNATKDDGETFVMYEAKDEQAAKLYYDMRVMTIKNSIKAMKDQIELCEHLLKAYDKELMHDDIADLEDSIKVLKKSIKESEEKLDCMGRNGVYVWVASSEDVMKDVQG